MRIRYAVLTTALLAAPMAAKAQPIQGLYVGAGAGYNLPENPSLASGGEMKPQGGFVGLGSIGYGLGNGFRFELEGDYRYAKLGGTSTLGAVTTGKLQTYGVLANALFDMDIGVPWLYPYIGGGVGYAWSAVSRQTILSPASAPFLGTTFNQTQGNFAFQAIGGLSFPIPNVPGLSLTTEYRFFGIPGSETFNGSLYVAGRPAPLPTTLKPQGQYNHSFLLGVRYAFNVAPPPVAAPPPAAPAPAPARSYLVFFDWDKATLTDRARQIIKDAADNSTHVQYTRIEVNGYTDTSGSPKYNQGLSVRRAQAVQAELVKDGVPQSAIAIQGFGDTHLLVPTGPGVREPQNRRVEIIIH
jgi:outer membrane protein OmpA-like peptidoglycan-associated protein